MGLKDLVQKIAGKGRTNTARNTVTQGEPNKTQPAAPSGQMTVLTAKDLEGVQGGAREPYLEIDIKNVTLGN